MGTEKFTTLVITGGPIIVKGDFEIIGVDKMPIVLTDDQKKAGVALCRCGKSQNKPFCDGSHLKG